MSRMPRRGVVGFASRGYDSAGRVVAGFFGFVVGS